MNQIPMAEASSSRQSKTQNDDYLITESDLEAAQQLMQLSDEDNSSNNIAGSKRYRTSDEEEVDQRPSEITLATIILEIFGKDVEVFPPKKQRRYRSLVNIYMATRPINAGNSRKFRA